MDPRPFVAPEHKLNGCSFEIDSGHAHIDLSLAGSSAEPSVERIRLSSNDLAMLISTLRSAEQSFQVLHQ